MEKALLVTVKMKHQRDNWRMEDIGEELQRLAKTAGAEVVDIITYMCERPTANLFLGTGKVEEIALYSAEQGVDTVIFSLDLSGTQQRNLEELIGRKTIDRTQLILDIFARHAKSPVGKMQVELAQLQYLLPRLTGKGIMLSRLGGGIGTRGPGEQKLEVDRRVIRKHIDKLGDDLKKAASHRLTGKKQRNDKAIPSVALVGYTNAGKSTLLNTLTGAGQVVADSLFTTLDPLSKSLILPHGEHIVVSDTVGFLNNLPHHLVEAFKATLEEVTESDLLVHVLDISHPRAREHHRSVMDVLKQLGCQEKPIITVLNKIDLSDDPLWFQEFSAEFPGSIAISAQKARNINLLLERIEEQFAGRMTRLKLIIPLTRMDLVDLFYREGRVEEIKYTQKGIRIDVLAPKILCNKVLKDKGIEIIY